MNNIYKEGALRLGSRTLTTGTQVMEGTIVVYIEIVDEMIPKISFNCLLICLIGRKVLVGINHWERIP